MNIYIDSKNHPHIRIDVLLASSKKVDCFIDTGYTGGLSLPDSFRSLINMDRISFQDFEIGNGSIMTVEMYKVKIRYEKVEKNISLMFTKGDDALVGIEFLTGFKLTLDLKKFTISLD